MTQMYINVHIDTHTNCFRLKQSQVTKKPETTQCITEDI